jgi:uncharacterized membrane protein
VLIGFNNPFVEMETLADVSQANPVTATILQSWHGDYPVAQLNLLPEKQRDRAVGYIEDAMTFEIIWKAFKPGEPVPTVDLRKNIVLFSRNTQFYNRISIGKINVTNGVAEILAMETMSAMPIEEKVGMSMALVSRKGIESIRTADGLVVIPEQAVPQTYVYECGNGYNFVAWIEGKKAWLFLPKQTVNLPYAPSDSGATYKKGLIMFRTKGEKAELEINGKRYSGCTNNRVKAVWEDAKLRGVDFRAVGNEPGWHMEITASEKMVFVGDYGDTVYSVATPQPLVDQQARMTTYKVQDAQHDLAVRIEGRPCQDTMSGEPFDATVTVILDDKEYRGCGKALH